ncbi:uncharacterized protein LOC134737586 [Pongo pygmaeus]|uniref:uncharacterized protein LOC134737586 n=1 Tax=Pongo pygmaeus TaxID=9600 RepID=UPI00300D4993
MQTIYLQFVSKLEEADNKKAFNIDKEAPVSSFTHGDRADIDLNQGDCDNDINTAEKVPIDDMVNEDKRDCWKRERPEERRRAPLPHWLRPRSSVVAIGRTQGGGSPASARPSGRQRRRDRWRRLSQRLLGGCVRTSAGRGHWALRVRSETWEEAGEKMPSESFCLAAQARLDSKWLKTDIQVLSVGRYESPVFRSVLCGQAQWLTPVIPAVWEAELCSQRRNALERQASGFWNIQKNMIRYLLLRKNKRRYRSRCTR